MVDAGGLDRVIHIVGMVALDVTQATLRGGDPPDDPFLGGGILNPAGYVALRQVALTNNRGHGGGMYSAGSASVMDSLVAENNAGPGGWPVD